MNSRVSPYSWVVSSDYTGEINARLGVAERLGHHEVVPLTRLEEFIGSARRGGPPDRGLLPDRAPDIVLSGTGEDTTRLLADLPLLLPEASFLNVFLASILPDELDPRIFDYDLIAAPPHPQLEARVPVVTLLGVPHRITRGRLEEAAADWRPFYEGRPRPLIGLLLGGHTRYCFGFTPEYGRSLGVRVRRLAESLGGAIVVTNSRRTPGDALVALRAEIADHEAAFLGWEEAKRGSYLGLLASADLLVVTGDSLSMCCESAFTGKPVYIALDAEATEVYHRRTVERLFDQGCARPLTGESHAPWRYPPLDPTQAVADEVLRLLARTPTPSPPDCSLPEGLPRE